MKDFQTFEHGADVGVIGYGQTQEQAFANGAKAMFNVMVNIQKVEPKQTVTVECNAQNIEELFVEWLNELIAQFGLQDLVFSEFSVKINKKDDSFQLDGNAKGEPLDKLKHEIKTEVKAATYSNLKIAQADGKWYAQCIVDV